MAIFFSAAGLFFRDVKYLVEMFLTFAIFFTPVFFDAAMFGDWKNLSALESRGSHPGRDLGRRLRPRRPPARLASL